MAAKTPVAIVAAFLLLSQPAFDQNNYLNTVTTAVPFLRMDVDARSSGMGDVGVALSNDANTIFNNGSKNIFNEDSLGFTVNYKNPSGEDWSAIFLSTCGFYRLNEKNAIGYGVRYFNFIQIGTGTLTEFKPTEIAADINFSRKLSNQLAAGLNLKYIYSNLATGQNIHGIQIKPADGVAADISLFYTNDFNSGHKNSNLSLGMNISNIGNKITYSSSIEKDYIPTNLGLGAAYGIDLNNYNKLTIAVDFNKLMTPTPDTSDNEANGIPDYKEKSVVSSMLGSFSDAPGGFEEEFHEVTLSTGLEYNFDNQLFVRGGYFYEHPSKGGRQFITTGGGVRYKSIQLDMAYLFPVDVPTNSLEPAFTVTLTAHLN